MAYSRKDILFLLLCTLFMRFFNVPANRKADYNGLGGFSLSLTA